MYMNQVAMTDGGGGGSSTYQVDYKNMYTRGNQINNQLKYLLHKHVKNIYLEIGNMHTYWTAVDQNSAYARLVKGVNATVDEMNKYMLDLNEIPRNLQEIANNYSRTDTQSDSPVGSLCDLRLCRVKKILEPNDSELKHDAAQIRASLSLINRDCNGAIEIANNIHTMIKGLDWTSSSSSGTFRYKAGTLCDNFVKSVENLNKAITEFINAEIDTVSQAEIDNCLGKRLPRGGGGGGGGGAHYVMEIM